MVKKIIGNLLTGLLVLLVVSQIILILMGYKLMYVKTGSMEPEIHQGSLIYVKNYKDKDTFYNKIEVGNDITYKTESGTVVTHRIINIDVENDLITTQGIIDGAAVDKSIHYSQVIGKVRLAIPVLGYLIMILQTWYFWVILICLIVIVFISKYLYKEIKKNKIEGK